MSQRPRVPLRSLTFFEKQLSELFFCPSCSHWRLSRPPQRQWSFSATRRTPSATASTSKGRLSERPCHLLLTTRRSKTYESHNFQPRTARITTAAAPSAINAPSTIPPRFRELHSALDALRTKAPEHVNLSQLSLALRGLESSNAPGGVVRVAILGLGAQDTARQLARLLLADPLKEKGRWEDELEQSKARTGTGAVLLRYAEHGGGEQDAGVQKAGSQLYTEINVPPTLLRRHNTEILVTGLSLDIAVQLPQGEMDRPSDALLVPNLEAGSGGRVTMVRYPVHKALVLGEGVGSCLAFGRFMGSDDGTAGRDGLVGFAVDMPGSRLEQTQEEALKDGVVALDIAKASQALDKFRKSAEFATDYERDWLHSGVPILHQWLVNGVPAEETTGNSTLKPVLGKLISHIINAASASLNTSEAAQLSTRLSTTAPPTAGTALKTALQEWSRKAHTELREELDEAFASKNWHKISWWKLLWRADDVTMIAEEVLERRWLLKAEKSGLWLMGRIEEAGLLPTAAEVAKPSPTPVERSSEESEKASSAEMGVLRQDMVVEPSSQSVSLAHISGAREVLSSETIPSLQATAQRLLIETLSTVSFTSSLSALLWLSSSFTVLEAASFAAFGLVWALRRLQKRWEGKKEQWEGDVREEGRLCLKGVEDGIARLLEEGKGVKEVETDEARHRREARAAIAKVNEALNELKASDV